VNVKVGKKFFHRASVTRDACVKQGMARRNDMPWPMQRYLIEQTDRQTDGRITALLYASYRRAGHNKCIGRTAYGDGHRGQL